MATELKEKLDHSLEEEAVEDDDEDVDEEEEEEEEEEDSVTHGRRSGEDYVALDIFS